MREYLRCRQDRIHFMVPRRSVGMIKGWGGRRIGRIQEETGCRIDITQGIVGELTCMCTIEGSPIAVRGAKVKIKEIVYKWEAEDEEDRDTKGRQVSRETQTKDRRYKNPGEPKQMTHGMDEVEQQEVGNKRHDALPQEEI